jgi:hypothetical protein
MPALRPAAAGQDRGLGWGDKHAALGDSCLHRTHQPQQGLQMHGVSTPPPTHPPSRSHHAQPAASPAAPPAWASRRRRAARLTATPGAELGDQGGRVQAHAVEGHHAGVAQQGHEPRLLRGRGGWVSWWGGGPCIHACVCVVVVVMGRQPGESAITAPLSTLKHTDPTHDACWLRGLVMQCHEG